MHKTIEQSLAGDLRVFRRELRLPCDDLKFGCKPEELLSENDYTFNLRKTMDYFHNRVRSNIEFMSKGDIIHNDVEVFSEVVVLLGRLSSVKNEDQVAQIQTVPLNGNFMTSYSNEHKHFFE